MLFSAYSGAKSAKVLDERLRSIEQRLGHSRASAMATETTGHVGDTVAAALGAIANRFLGGANSANILESAKSMSSEAGNIASGAAKLSDDVVRRLGREIVRRPLITLSVAIGVGVLVGLVGHRR
jgi:hypothetical protein